MYEITQGSGNSTDGGSEHSMADSAHTDTNAINRNSVPHKRRAETIEAFLSLPPEELLEKLTEEYSVTIPVAVTSPDDLDEVARLLSLFSANYIFFTEAALHAEMRKKLLKKVGAEKKDIDDAISREKILSTFADIEKSAYNAVSRMMTAYSQRQYEINMSRHG